MSVNFHALFKKVSYHHELIITNQVPLCDHCAIQLKLIIDEVPILRLALYGGGIQIKDCGPGTVVPGGIVSRRVVLAKVPLVVVILGEDGIGNIIKRRAEDVVITLWYHTPKFLWFKSCG